ncbi:hypothetical protein AVEN_150938-1 [Araneus ventricosus]|uniref:Uncharacterized protein n=1 Tax=Araneus ventricosus TaxID=182803 RepID=A0A4Y2BK75_ARAVE|nr:hypothetical protein AVEN_150938-1 [Araneus ventricosus]
MACLYFRLNGEKKGFRANVCRYGYTSSEWPALDEQVHRSLFSPSNSSMIGPPPISTSLCPAIFKPSLSTASRGDPVRWPACQTSHVWIPTFGVHIKAKVHKTPVDSDEDLVSRISVAAGEIRDMPGMFEIPCSAYVILVSELLIKFPNTFCSMCMLLM